MAINMAIKGSSTTTHSETMDTTIIMGIMATMDITDTMVITIDPYPPILLKVNYQENSILRFSQIIYKKMYEFFHQYKL
jgi:hypothetical protein